MNVSIKHGLCPEKFGAEWTLEFLLGFYIMPLHMLLQSVSHLGPVLTSWEITFVVPFRPVVTVIMKVNFLLANGPKVAIRTLESLARFGCSADALLSKLSSFIDLLHVLSEKRK